MPKPQTPPIPPLTVAELEMLRYSPADEVTTIRGTAEVKTAQRLIERGLLERNPSATAMRVRCTEKGESAACPLTKSVAERIYEEIVELSQEDEEAATGRERALWRRVLLELATTHVPKEQAAYVLERLAQLSRIALRSDGHEFRRFLG